MRTQPLSAGGPITVWVRIGRTRQIELPKDRERSGGGWEGTHRLVLGGERHWFDTLDTRTASERSFDWLDNDLVS